MFTHVNSRTFTQDRDEGKRSRGDLGLGADRPRPLDRLLTELNLTEDQRKQVGQIVDTHRQATENRRKENQATLRDLNKQLDDATESGDKDKIKAAGQAVEKIDPSRKAEQENVIKQLKDVLTPDQSEKAKKFMEERERLGDRGPGEAGL